VVITSFSLDIDCENAIQMLMEQGIGALASSFMLLILNAFNNLAIVLVLQCISRQSIARYVANTHVNRVTMLAVRDLVFF